MFLEAPFPPGSQHSCQHFPVGAFALRPIPERKRSERSALSQPDGLGKSSADRIGIEVSRVLVGSDAEISAIAAMEGQVVAVSESVFRYFQRKG